MTRPSPTLDLGALSFRLLRAVSHIAHRGGDPHGLSEIEVALLQFLLGRFATNKQLADALSIDPARVARTVHKLNESGLVIRGRPPNDRRTVLNSLSGDGERLALDLRNGMQQATSELLEGVSAKELDTFVGVIGKIDANYTRISGNIEATPPPPPAIPARADVDRELAG